MLETGGVRVARPSLWAGGFRARTTLGDHRFARVDADERRVEVGLGAARLCPTGTRITRDVTRGNLASLTLSVASGLYQFQKGLYSLATSLYVPSKPTPPRGPAPSGAACSVGEE